MNSKLKKFIDIYAYDGILHLASADSKETLNKVLAEPFDPEVHYPLAYIHLHYAMLKEAKVILDYTQDKEDETYKQLEDYLNALSECERSNIGIFPLTISYRKWWNGPHLAFPEEFKGQKQDVWYPIRLDYIDEKFAYLSMAIKEGKKINYYNSVKVPVGETKESELGLMGEIVFYGDDYLIKFHNNGPWVHTSELKYIHDIAYPIIVKSHENLNKQIEEDLKS